MLGEVGARRVGGGGSHVPAGAPAQTLTHQHSCPSVRALVTKMDRMFMQVAWLKGTRRRGGR